MAVATYQFVPSLAESISESLASLSSAPSPEFTNTEPDLNVSETAVSLMSGDSSSTLWDSNATESEGLETSAAQATVRRIPPPEVTTTQGITMRIPQSVRVDPRARSVFLPQIYAESLNTLLVCLSSNSLLLDIGSQGVEDSIDSEDLKVTGDRSNNLVISGDPQTVTSVLNGVSGIRAFRDSGGVANQSLVITLVDLSRPSLDTDFCQRSTGGNSRTITLLPLALEQRITDGRIRLGK